MVDAYCTQLYPDHYDPQRRILDFGDDYQNLQGHVAEIGEDLRKSQPKIRFFEERNPDWRRGTELPCVSVLEVPVLWKFIQKISREKLGGRQRSRKESLQTS